MSYYSDSSLQSRRPVSFGSETLDADALATGKLADQSQTLKHGSSPTGTAAVIVNHPIILNAIR